MTVSQTVTSILKAATAEILALRAEVERLQAKEVGWFMGDKEAAAAEMARLRAEIERLTVTNPDPPRFTATVNPHDDTGFVQVVIADGGETWADLYVSHEQAKALAEQINGAQPAPTLFCVGEAADDCDVASGQPQTKLAFI